MKEIKREEMVGGRCARCKSAFTEANLHDRSMDSVKSAKDHDSIDKLRRDSKTAAFTLIELIVVMAIIAILTLLAVPKLMGYTQEARYTKLITTSKELERASERYFMDHEDWPRLTDDAYSAEEIHTFAEKIYDITGKEVILDPAGNYYDIDYDKLSQYVKVPDAKMHYVLRNPVGKVYALEGLTEIAKERATQVKPTDISFKNETISIATGNTFQLELIFAPEDTTVRNVIYSTSHPEIATINENGLISGISSGVTQITVMSADKSITKAINITVNEPFVSGEFLLTGKAETFIVPETGFYKLEVWGASGGDTASKKGGKGGYSKADFSLVAGDILYLYAGGKGQAGSLNATFNGGGIRGTIYAQSGGGGSDIRLNGDSLTDRIIVAGGGGGANNNYVGGFGGGANQHGGAGASENIQYYRNALGGTLTAGGGYSGSVHTSNPGQIWSGGKGAYKSSSYSGGGGGGGGYYGGAGGVEYGGGGGGSGYANTSIAIPGTIVGTTGLHLGDGKVKITFIGD